MPWLEHWMQVQGGSFDSQASTDSFLSWLLGCWWSTFSSFFFRHRNFSSELILYWQVKECECDGKFTKYNKECFDFQITDRTFKRLILAFRSLSNESKHKIRSTFLIPNRGNSKILLRFHSIKGQKRTVQNSPVKVQRTRPLWRNQDSRRPAPRTAPWPLVGWSEGNPALHRHTWAAGENERTLLSSWSWGWYRGPTGSRLSDKT